MTKRAAYTTAGVSLGVLAFVGFAALFEHFAGLKGDEWLRNILPFGLASSPTSLSLIAVGAFAGAYLLLKAARAGELGR